MAMPKSIDHLIVPTPKGVKIELKTLYVYPDGHINLEFADGINWPLADEYEVVGILSLELLRKLQKAAKRHHRKPPKNGDGVPASPL
jgi:hypothetical protein